MNSFITIDSQGTDVLFSGNEAIARGCIEAGVSLVTGYPGTPTTPVIEILKAADSPIRARWGINEKVAFDFATGKSWAGLRSLVTMKMSGLNVASDSILSVAASGTVGGLVIYVGDDPNGYYGMVEQDSRYYARLSSAPMLVDNAILPLNSARKNANTSLASFPDHSSFHFSIFSIISFILIYIFSKGKDNYLSKPGKLFGCAISVQWSSL